MIELKPYQETVRDVSDKDKKRQIGGQLQTGKEAYEFRYDDYNFSDPKNMIIFIIALVTCIVLIRLIELPLTHFNMPENFIKAVSLFVLCLTPIMYMILVYVINRVWQRYLGQYLGQPTLFVSTEKARIGEKIKVQFQQPIKRNLLLKRWSVELIGREWVDYPSVSRTSQSIYEHIMQAGADQEQRLLVAGDTYTQDVTFAIPPHAMHSFALPDNSLTWLIRVTFIFKDFMPLSETYAIQVTPEIHVL